MFLLEKSAGVSDLNIRLSVKTIFFILFIPNIFRLYISKNQTVHIKVKKMKKILMILICAGVLGLSVMTASAEERQLDQSSEDEIYKMEDPILIAPNPDNGFDDQMLISPNPDLTDEGSEQPLIAPSPSASVEKSDLLANVDIPILGMIVATALIVIALIVVNKRK